MTECSYWETYTDDLVWDTVSTFETDVLDVVECGIDGIIIQALRYMTSYYIQAKQDELLTMPLPDNPSVLSHVSLKDYLLRPYEHQLG